MNCLKKRIGLSIMIVLVGVILFSSMVHTAADDRGCCTSPYPRLPGAICQNNVQERQCCPTDSPSPYGFDLGPTSFDDCVSGGEGYFLPGDVCPSPDPGSRCEKACCCFASEPGRIVSQAACTASEGIVTDDAIDAVSCREACGDTVASTLFEQASSSGACDSPDDYAELKLKVQPVTREKMFKLEVVDQCLSDASEYIITRCKNENCDDADSVETFTIPRALVRTGEFYDRDSQLEFLPTRYEYKITAVYDTDPTPVEGSVEYVEVKAPFENVGTLGDVECWNKNIGEEFCLSESFYEFDVASYFEDHALDMAYYESHMHHPGTFCTGRETGLMTLVHDSEVCDFCFVDDDGAARCKSAIDCSLQIPDDDPFGVSDSKSLCEERSDGSKKSCFYDDTQTNSRGCFDCERGMRCIDYKSADACGTDNCGVGGGACSWKTYDDPRSGTTRGVCVDARTSNCLWCDKAGTGATATSNPDERLFSYDVLIDSCTREKSGVLSTDENACLFREDLSDDMHESIACDNAVCSDITHSDCSAAPAVDNPCGLTGCVWSSGRCARDTDGEAGADCDGVADPDACEADRFAPRTTVTGEKDARGEVFMLEFDIHDKEHSGESYARIPDRLFGLGEGEGYRTYVCFDGSCGSYPTNYNELLTRQIFVDDGRFFQVFDGDVTDLVSLPIGMVADVSYVTFDRFNNREDGSARVFVSDGGIGPIVTNMEVTDGIVNEEGGVIGVTAGGDTAAVTIDLTFESPITAIPSSLLIGESDYDVAAMFAPGGTTARLSFTNIPTGMYELHLDARDENGITMPLACPYLDSCSKRIVVDNDVPTVRGLYGDTIIEGALDITRFDDVPVDGRLVRENLFVDDEFASFTLVLVFNEENGILFDSGTISQSGTTIRTLSSSDLANHDDVTEIGGASVIVKSHRAVDLPNGDYQFTLNFVDFAGRIVSFSKTMRVNTLTPEEDSPIVTPMIPPDGEVSSVTAPIITFEIDEPHCEDISCLISFMVDGVEKKDGADAATISERFSFTAGADGRPHVVTYDTSTDPGFAKESREGVSVTAVVVDPRDPELLQTEHSWTFSIDDSILRPTAILGKTRFSGDDPTESLVFGDQANRDIIKIAPRYFDVTLGRDDIVIDTVRLFGGTNFDTPYDIVVAKADSSPMVVQVNEFLTDGVPEGFYRMELDTRLRYEPVGMTYSYYFVVLRNGIGYNIVSLVEGERIPFSVIPNDDLSLTTFSFSVSDDSDCELFEHEDGDETIDIRAENEDSVCEVLVSDLLTGEDLVTEPIGLSTSNVLIAVEDFPEEKVVGEPVSIVVEATGYVEGLKAFITRPTGGQGFAIDKSDCSAGSSGAATYTCTFTHTYLTQGFQDYVVRVVRESTGQEIFVDETPRSFEVLGARFGQPRLALSKDAGCSSGTVPVRCEVLNDADSVSSVMLQFGLCDVGDGSDAYHCLDNPVDSFGDPIEITSPASGSVYEHILDIDSLGASGGQGVVGVCRAFSGPDDISDQPAYGYPLCVLDTCEVGLLTFDDVPGVLSFGNYEVTFSHTSLEGRPLTDKVAKVVYPDDTEQTVDVTSLDDNRYSIVVPITEGTPAGKGELIVSAREEGAAAACWGTTRLSFVVNPAGDPALDENHPDVALTLPSRRYVQTQPSIISFEIDDLSGVDTDSVVVRLGSLEYGLPNNPNILLFEDGVLSLTLPDGIVLETAQNDIPGRAAELGLHTLEVEVMDIAGNKKDTPHVFDFVIDEEARVPDKVTLHSGGTSFVVFQKEPRIDRRIIADEAAATFLGSDTFVEIDLGDNALIGIPTLEKKDIVLGGDYSLQPTADPTRFKVTNTFVEGTYKLTLQLEGRTGGGLPIFFKVLETEPNVPDEMRIRSEEDPMRFGVSSRHQALAFDVSGDDCVISAQSGFDISFDAAGFENWFTISSDLPSEGRCSVTMTDSFDPSWSRPLEITVEAPLELNTEDMTLVGGVLDPDGDTLFTRYETLTFVVVFNKNVDDSDSEFIGRLDSGNGEIEGINLGGSPTVKQFTFSDVDEGEHTFSVRVDGDVLGTLSFVVDQTVPVLDVSVGKDFSFDLELDSGNVAVLDSDDVVGTDALERTSRVPIQFSYEDDFDVNLRSVSLDGVSLQDAIAVDESGSRTVVTVDPHLDVSEGLQSLVIDVCDIAGNCVRNSAGQIPSYQFDVDALSLSLEILNPVFGRWRAVDSDTYTLTFLADEDVSSCSAEYNTGPPRDFYRELTLSRSGNSFTSSGVEGMMHDALTAFSISCIDSRNEERTFVYSFMVDSIDPTIQDFGVRGIETTDSRDDRKSYTIFEEQSIVLFSEVDEPSRCFFNNEAFSSNDVFRELHEHEALRIETHGTRTYLMQCRDRANRLTQTKHVDVTLDLFGPIRLLSKRLNNLACVEGEACVTGDQTPTLYIRTNDFADCFISGDVLGSEEKPMSTTDGVLYSFTDWDEDLSYGEHSFRIRCDDASVHNRADLTNGAFTFSVSEDSCAGTCGGDCGACAEGDPCSVDNDCRMGLTCENNVCSINEGDDPALMGISLEPDETTVEVNVVTQYAAIAHYDDGSTDDITGVVDLEADPSELVVVTQDRSVLSQGIGDVTISTRYEGFDAQALLHIVEDVENPVPAHIKILPHNPQFGVGQDVPYSVTLYLTDGSTQDVTSEALMSSDDSSIATLDTTVPSIVGVDVGTTRVTASFEREIDGTMYLLEDDVSVSVVEVHTRQLESISLSPEFSRREVNAGVAYTVTAHYSDGTEGIVTAGATLSANPANAVEISDGKSVTGLRADTVLITASYEGKEAEATLEVIDEVVHRELSHIEVEPHDATRNVDEEIVYSVNVFYTNGEFEDVTSYTSYVSNDTEVASFDDSSQPYILDTHVPGVVNVSVTYETTIGETTFTGRDSAIVTVHDQTAKQLSEITIEPSVLFADVGEDVVFDVTAHYSDGSHEDVSESGDIVFKSSDDDVVTMSGNVGSVVTPGVITVGANYKGKTTYAIIHAQTDFINLISPSLGVATEYVFDIVAETVGPDGSTCKWSFDNPTLDFEFMNEFSTSDGLQHIESNFNENYEYISDGDESGHTFVVRCDTDGDASVSEENKLFEIRVDNSEPVIEQAVFNPSVVADTLPGDAYPKSLLFIETDEDTTCKYHDSEVGYDDMTRFVGGSDSFSEEHEVNVSLESGEGTYDYFVSCRNKAELTSAVSKVSVEYDPNVPLTITSRSRELYNRTHTRAAPVDIAVETNRRASCSYQVVADTQQPMIGDGSRTIHSASPELENGTHTIAVSCVALGGITQTTNVRVVLDATDPYMVEVDDKSKVVDFPEESCSTEKIRAKWLGEDPDSGISHYEYRVYDELDTAVNNWTESDEEDDFVWLRDLNLDDGTTYFVKVRPFNQLTVLGEEMESDGVTINSERCDESCEGDDCDTQSCEETGTCGEFTECESNSDCDTGYCNDDTGLCATPRCNDDVKNGNETDEDCGGDSCSACKIDQTCKSDSDCLSDICEFRKCQEADTCRNGQLDHTETDLDCGGACRGCDVGFSCETDLDCDGTLVCSSERVCEEPDSLDRGDDNDESPSGNANRDKDGDGMRDDWEIRYGLDPNDPSDADIDSDNDLLLNRQEFSLGTDPLSSDTDGDDHTDKEEIDASTDPTDPASFPSSVLGVVIPLLLGILIVGAGTGYVVYTTVRKKGGGSLSIDSLFGKKSVQGRRAPVPGQRQGMPPQGRGPRVPPPPGQQRQAPQRGMQGRPGQVPPRGRIPPSPSQQAAKSFQQASRGPQVAKPPVEKKPEVTKPVIKKQAAVPRKQTTSSDDDIFTELAEKTGVEKPVKKITSKVTKPARKPTLDELASEESSIMKKLEKIADEDDAVRKRGPTKQASKKRKKTTRSSSSGSKKKSSRSPKGAKKKSGRTKKK